TNTVNKGAELMLYAVLEQLEKHYPDAHVVYVPNSRGNYKPIGTNLNFKERKVLRYSRYPEAILRRLKLPRAFLTAKYPDKTVDVVLDAGGFQFSDQWGYPDHYLDLLENYYKKLHEAGCKVILLSQAFGPFKTEHGKRTAVMLQKYADLLIAREQISYDHLCAAGVDQHKIVMFPDFTLAVAGVVPPHLTHLQGKACIIPNKKMITHAGKQKTDYIGVMQKLIEHILASGRAVFLLNHEGEGDLTICHKLNAFFDDKLEIVTGLNAKEVKGVIGNSYLVISSRFHGVASALSQAVPCLSTSWSHKYAMLFKDYELTDSVLPIENTIAELTARVDGILQPDNNAAMRGHLKIQKEKLAPVIETMWQKVFSTMER
ncbi:MAG: polysaccharide pyruvyl transferase family protein, partial [Leeuwenhoekiella sp.]